MTALAFWLALFPGVWSQAGLSEPVIPAPLSPLLVIVERSRGTSVNPDSVRHAIAAELGRLVVGPMDTQDGDDLEMLVVTLTPDSVKMQMRSAGISEPQRKITALPSGEMGLKVVAWLAGNLARHQAADFTPDAPVHERRDALEPPALPVKTSPPPISAPPIEEPLPETVAGQSSAFPGPSTIPKWRVGLSLGRTATYGRFTTTRVEVIGALRDRRWCWSATLDVIRYGDREDEYDGAVGLTRRFALWPGLLDFDLTGGLGIAAVQMPVMTYTSMTIATSTASSLLLGGVFAQVTGMLALTHWRYAELVAGATLDAYSSNLGGEPGITALAGVRIGLPE